MINRLSGVGVLVCAAPLFSAPCLAGSMSLEPFYFECTITYGAPCPIGGQNPTSDGGLYTFVRGTASAYLNIPFWQLHNYKQTADTAVTYVLETLFTLHGDPGESATITASVDSWATLNVHANPYAYGYVNVQVWSIVCGHLHCYYPSVDYDPPFETALYWMENPQSPWDSTISRTYEWPLELMQLGRLEVNNNPPGYETYDQYMAVYTALSFIMTASTDKPGYQWYGDPAASGTGQASIHLSATPDAPADVPEPASMMPVLGVLAAIILAQRRKLKLGAARVRD